MRGWLVALLLLFSAPVGAQALARPHAELPSADQPRRQVATTGYTLALIWMPETCGSPRRKQDAECRRGVASNGFTLHGLWPDGEGPDRWPQYCRQVGILSDAELRHGVGATPSPQLMQHEWAKHGSCMSPNAAAYFDTESTLFRALKIPDLRSLGRQRGATVGDVQQAFARSNAMIPAGSVRVHLNKHEYLDEIWLCLDLQRHYRSCTAEQGGGAALDQTVRIETRGL